MVFRNSINAIWVGLAFYFGALYFSGGAFSGESEAFDAKEVLIYFGEHPEDEKNKYFKIFDEQLGEIQKLLEDNNFIVSLKGQKWPRVMRDIVLQDNAFVFGIMRSQEREGKFNWIKAYTFLNDNDYILIGKNIEKNENLTKEEIVKGNFNVLCERKTFSCSELLRFGFREEQLFKVPLTFTTEDAVGLLKRGRVDFIMIGSEFLKEIIENNNQQEKFLPIMKVTNSMPYFAAPKNVDPKLLGEITRILNQEQN